MAKHHKKHHGKHKARGGGAEHGGEGHEKHMVASGNPNVIKEAEEHKKGGKVGKHKKHHRAKGGPVTKTVGLMTGGAVRPRLDRPGRKSGGRVGSDTSPLTSAHHARSGSSEKPREQEGGMSS
jgi:hypothetical protein